MKQKSREFRRLGHELQKDSMNLQDSKYHIPLFYILSFKMLKHNDYHHIIQRSPKLPVPYELFLS